VPVRALLDVVCFGGVGFAWNYAVLCLVTVNGSWQDWRVGQAYPIQNRKKEIYSENILSRILTREAMDMPIRFLQMKPAIIFAIALLAIEGSLIVVVQPNPVGLWFTIFSAIFLSQICQLIPSLWKFKSAVRLKRQWFLLFLSFLLQAITYAMRAQSVWVNRVLQHKSHWAIGYRELFIVFAYIPVLLLCSIPSGRPYRRIFFCIDAAQAMIVGYLGYVKLFSVIPFTNTPTVPISHLHITHFYAVADLTIAMAGTLRLFASTNSDEWRFHHLLCLYLWIGAFLHYPYNTVSSLWIEPLVLIPGLAFYVLVSSLPLECTQEGAVLTSNKLTILFNTISPVLFTCALLALAIDVVPQYFRFGIACIIAAFVLYGLRSTVLQNSYEQSQLFLKQAHDKLEELTLKDALTGVANRRCFDQRLELEWGRAIREQTPLSLLLIDVDFFKNLNDRYGHRFGDECLIQIASALKSELPRSSDLLARYGGEEFSAILPGTTQTGAQTLAGRMQNAVNALEIKNESSIGSHATISVGIATYVFPCNGSPGLLLEASDKALYQAKANGRNRIELGTMSLLPSNPLQKA
jgi:diguanylate cyclase (GGDEF)-like protein